MTIVKFKADYNWYRGAITRMEFTSETAKFLVDQYGRHAKESAGVKYFDTWAEAHAELTARAVASVASTRRDMESADAFASKVKDMREPT